MKKTLIVIPIIAFGLFLFMARISKYHDFHDAKIEGKINTFYRYRDYVMVHVKGVEFRIIPVSLNGIGRFDNTAKVGDSIFKPAGRDTFTLIHHGGETVYYTVKMF